MWKPVTISDSRLIIQYYDIRITQDTDQSVEPAHETCFTHNFQLQNDDSVNVMYANPFTTLECLQIY